jgi:hypothetical protein
MKLNDKLDTIVEGHPALIANFPTKRLKKFREILGGTRPVSYEDLKTMIGIEPVASDVEGHDMIEGIYNDPARPAIGSEIDKLQEGHEAVFGRVVVETFPALGSTFIPLAVAGVGDRLDPTVACRSGSNRIVWVCKTKAKE